MTTKPLTESQIMRSSLALIEGAVADSRHNADSQSESDRPRGAADAVSEYNSPFKRTMDAVSRLDEIMGDMATVMDRAERNLATEADIEAIRGWQADLEAMIKVYTNAKRRGNQAFNYARQRLMQARRFIGYAVKAAEAGKWTGALEEDPVDWMLSTAKSYLGYARKDLSPNESDAGNHDLAERTTADHAHGTEWTVARADDHGDENLYNPEPGRFVVIAGGEVDDDFDIEFTQNETWLVKHRDAQAEIKVPGLGPSGAMAAEEELLQWIQRRLNARSGQPELPDADWHNMDREEPEIMTPNYENAKPGSRYAQVMEDLKGAKHETAPSTEAVLEHVERRSRQLTEKAAGRPPAKSADGSKVSNAKSMRNVLSDIERLVADF